MSWCVLWCVVMVGGEFFSGWCVVLVSVMIDMMLINVVFIM